jgi:hypothetical protein
MLQSLTVVLLPGHWEPDGACCRTFSMISSLDIGLSAFAVSSSWTSLAVPYPRTLDEVAAAILPGCSLLGVYLRVCTTLATLTVWWSSPELERSCSVPMASRLLGGCSPFGIYKLEGEEAGLLHGYCSHTWRGDILGHRLGSMALHGLCSMPLFHRHLLTASFTRLSTTKYASGGSGGIVFRDWQCSSVPTSALFMDRVDF